MTIPSRVHLSVHAVPLPEVVKSDRPSAQGFMTVALLRCNEGWRKCAQHFTLINVPTVLQSCSEHNTLSLQYIDQCLFSIWHISLCLSSFTLPSSINQLSIVKLLTISLLKSLTEQEQAVCQYYQWFRGPWNIISLLACWGGSIWWQRGEIF